ncbi:MAG TPA: cytochrome C, partial [Gammaproteobacteria bacterium]|nr:cytochrome C [Gammaproteobacteria bacterium]
MTGILIFSFYGLGQSLASGGFESDDHDLDHEYRQDYEHNGRRDTATADPMYAEECGSCHMAYPAALLPV